MLTTPADVAMDSSTSPVPDPTLKRKRDDTPTAPDAPTPVSKASRTAPTSGANSLSINYLARQSQDDLPLVNKEDTLPNLLQLLASYGSILDRHESLASNLGARPLGPILIKRFERCFDSPPRVVASHHKSAASAHSAGGADEQAAQQITWLEVIEFARSHPSQFTLSTFSEGKRVCQFYYPQKQLRVQISEEDFLFINSGRCQELIPPLPIWEDEEKEVATCDVLEAKLKELTNAADMVAARTRQLSHRLKGRRAAILERRAEGGYGTPAKASAIQPTTAPPPSVASGFTAVNSTIDRPVGERSDHSHSLGLSINVRHDLLRHFESLPQNQTPVRSRLRRLSMPVADAPSRQMMDADNAAPVSNTSSLSPGPHSGYGYEQFSSTVDSSHGARPSTNGGQSLTPSQAGLKHNFSRPLPPALEERQPFRPLCQAHMDSLPRGQRVLPPCDRCRRLKMDCVKNLTSCQGCTKKHARCHWRDVSREELGTLDHLMDAQYTLGLGSAGHHTGNDDSDDDDSNPLEDLEALGEKEEREVLERLRDDVEESLHDDIAATTTVDHSRSRIWLNGNLHEHYRPSSSHAVESPISASSPRSERGPSGIVDTSERSPPRSKVHDLNRLLDSITAPPLARQAGIFDSLSPDSGLRAGAGLTPSRISGHITSITSSMPMNGDLTKGPHQPRSGATSLTPFDATATHAHGGFRAVNETPSAAKTAGAGVGVLKNPAWQTV